MENEELKSFTQTDLDLLLFITSQQNPCKIRSRWLCKACWPEYHKRNWLKALYQSCKALWQKGGQMLNWCEVDQNRNRRQVSRLLHLQERHASWVRRSLHTWTMIVTSKNICVSANRATITSFLRLQAQWNVSKVMSHFNYRIVRRTRRNRSRSRISPIQYV